MKVVSERKVREAAVWIERARELGEASSSVDGMLLKIQALLYDALHYEEVES